MTVSQLTETQAGQLEALLTEPLLATLWKACQRRCFGTFDPEDLYSMTLLKVTRSFDTFKGGNFPAWVMTVMVSEWKNELKRRARHPDPLSMSTEDGWDHDMTDGYVLEDEVLTEYSPEIQAALATLNPKHRRAFLLFAEGYTHREIMQILGVEAVGTSLSMVTRARVKLQKMLAG